jgi:ribosomal protein S18 acetylase RimI-like enzyme
VNVRRLEAEDRVWLRERLHEGWGDEAMAGHGELFFPAAHDGFVAEGRAGVVTYRIDADACEITLIESYEPGRGVGTALLGAVIAEARTAGCSRVWLVTTNDNEHARRWYAARGFETTDVRRGAIDSYRETLKPSIPMVGEGGVPITDEIEFVLTLPAPDRR